MQQRFTNRGSEVRKPALTLRGVTLYWWAISIEVTIAIVATTISAIVVSAFTLLRALSSLNDSRFWTARSMAKASLLMRTSCA